MQKHKQMFSYKIKKALSSSSSLDCCLKLFKSNYLAYLYLYISMNQPDSVFEMIALLVCDVNNIMKKTIDLPAAGSQSFSVCGKSNWIGQIIVVAFKSLKQNKKLRVQCPSKEDQGWIYCRLTQLYDLLYMAFERCIQKCYRCSPSW